MGDMADELYHQELTYELTHGEGHEFYFKQPIRRVYMSKTYEKVGKGRFFENDQGGNDKRPAFKGTAEINGVDFEIALWPRTAKNSGTRFLSISFNVKGEREEVGDGALFLRDNANRRAPAFSGPLTIGGKDFEGSVWAQTSESGREYYSLKIESVTEEA